MKKSICLSALLILLPVSVVQADLEFTPFPLKVADPEMPNDIDRFRSVTDTNTLIPDSLVKEGVKIPSIDWTKSISPKGGHDTLRDWVISAGG